MYSNQAAPSQLTVVSEKPNTKTTAPMQNGNEDNKNQNEDENDVDIDAI